ncbi:Crp/Fnr family transcriptional regulator [Mycobacterium sp. GA-2829]|uniref:Crp/Fnr family transcriptional regulator n=1 Tax=Mycobacterium sp. GA-2829 TaxID=1772283 RepID=UPI00073FF99D|nr:Crp/Fnr family transcriptional regulator [Mycobacterium sp. GA-2829]KUI29259.1 hypothetical protein AU194_20505 [Mycobacterium sp. GA-2829]
MPLRGLRRPPNIRDDDLKSAAGLLDLLVPESFSPDQLIFGQGLPGDRVHIIESGVVKIRRSDLGGRDRLIALAGPGDIVGELAVLDPGPRTSSVVALDWVETRSLDRSALREWIAGDPAAGSVLLQLLARLVKRQHDRFAEQRKHDTETLVARVLVDLSERLAVVSDDGSIATPPLTDAELADLVGTSQDEVATVLRSFADKGVIAFEGATVVTCDRDELRRHSGLDRP